MKLTEKYNLTINAEELEKELVQIKEKAKANFNEENLKIALGAIDLTSLHTSDTPEFITKSRHSIHSILFRHRFAFILTSQRP